jgi:hypothetical protein
MPAAGAGAGVSLAGLVDRPAQDRRPLPGQAGRRTKATRVTREQASATAAVSQRSRHLLHL